MWCAGARMCWGLAVCGSGRRDVVFVSCQRRCVSPGVGGEAKGRAEGRGLLASVSLLAGYMLMLHPAAGVYVGAVATGDIFAPAGRGATRRDCARR